jgi:hypothetical protein
MRTWLKEPLDNEFDDRHIVAHVALWCLAGEDTSRRWLIQTMELKQPESVAVPVQRALGWGHGERAASLFTELITTAKFDDKWFGANANRDQLQRALSRLPLSDAQLAEVELVMKVPVPSRCMDKSALSDDTLDEKPQAPSLKPRSLATKP